MVDNIEKAIKLIEQKMPSVQPEDVPELGILVQKVLTAFAGVNQVAMAAQMKSLTV